MISKDEIMQVLSTINDPELNRSLTELDMVKFVEIDGGAVRIGISLTIPGCPLKNKIGNDIKQTVGQMSGVEKVEVEFDAMSEAQRRNLVTKLSGDKPKQNTPNGEMPVSNIGDFAKRIIAVASGKGGVGKSTVTGNLAAALSHMGFKVGVLDADVYGFSIPRIMGISGQPTIIDEQIVPLRKENMQVISMGFFVDEDSPIIWRGPLLHKVINQFLSDVLWDKNDFLLIDLPPGTGDVTITIAQSIPKAELLVVTTPQPVASHTAGRVAKLAEKTNIKVLGVIENMAYYESNGTKEYIFGKDGGKNLALELKVPLLGQIPLKTEIREGADAGNLAVLSNNDEIAKYYLNIAGLIVQNSG
jgi:ATP-binding protein involved in chromosome partitioning